MNLSPLPRTLILAMLMSFASETGAQDSTGLGGLPQGRALPPAIRAEAMRARSMSLSADYTPGAKSMQAPLMASTDPVLGISRHLETPHAGARAGCERSTADLCYDVTDNRIVYRPARQYMPGLKGLTAENISLRHNGILFKYSFQ